jgi:hypothetical protein
VRCCAGRRSKGFAGWKLLRVLGRPQGRLFFPRSPLGDIGRVTVPPLALFAEPGTAIEDTPKVAELERLVATDTLTGA